ncbi:MAG: hypothetical protein JXX14_13300 [Deltaproteobacteria bacterium]|nr:hypothetical protein [Deltaproteobacteria bacterium]
MRTPFFAIILFFVLPVLALGQETSTSEETAPDPAVKVMQSSVSVDMAKPAPRVNGSLQSYMFMSQRRQMQMSEPGRYERQNLNVMPFYEIITLRADHLGLDGLSIHFQGIAGVDLLNVYLDNRFVADPVYGYIQLQNRVIDARLGRMMIFSGAAEGLHIDGGRITLFTPAHLGLDGYAGLLVSPRQGPDWYQNESTDRFDEFGRGYTDWKRDGDFAVGGRLFFRYEEVINMGVSLLQLSDNRETAARLLGTDLLLTPADWMSLTGKTNIDLTTMALRDAGAYLDFFMGSKVNVGAHYRHVDPSLFIANTSIFSVFSNEKHNAVGGSLAIMPIKRLTIKGAYSQLFYQFLDADDEGWTPAMELGQQIDADAIVKFGQLAHFGNARIGFGRVARDLTAVNQLRIGALIPFGSSGVKSALNYYMDFYQDTKLDGQTGILGDVSVFYYTSRIRTGATFRGGKTPYSEAEIQGMLTFAYNFMKTYSNQE